MYDHWSHLPDLQFRALGRMALTALDQPNGDVPAATYFGGHERIAQAWRSPWPEGDDEESKRKRRNLLNDVRKVIRALEGAGAVKPLDTGTVRLGHSQRYLLTI